MAKKLAEVPEKRVNPLQLKASDRNHVREKQIVHKIPNFNRGPEHAKDSQKTSELRTVY